MGQAESIGDFRYDPDDWEQERSTGNYRPRRRSADALPFLRPRTPLQFGTVPTALPVNPADYVGTTVRRKAVDVDDWDARLGTEEYVLPEHANLVGIDPVEEARMSEQRYEDYLDAIFPGRKEWKESLAGSSGEGPSSTRHVRIGPPDAKPMSEPPRPQAEPANRESRKHRLERSSSESITDKPPARTEPPRTSKDYEAILDKAFPKRKAQMQQRHQRQQQQMLKLPDPPKPPAYRNPHVKPGMRRSASTTVLLDTKKRSTSLPSAAVSLGPNIRPVISGYGFTTDRQDRCQCQKCSGDPASTELHRPSTTSIAPPSEALQQGPSPSSAGPSSGRITVDMHLRVHMDIPASTSLAYQTPEAQSGSQGRNYPRRHLSNTRHPRSYVPHQQAPISRTSSGFGVSTSAAPSDYYSSRPPYDNSQPHQQHGHQSQPQSQAIQPPQHHPLFQFSSPPPLHHLSWAELQQLQQKHAAYARAHLSPLQTRYESPVISPGGYTMSPGSNTPASYFSLLQAGQQSFQSKGRTPSASAPRMGMQEEVEEYEDADEDEDEEDPYHDDRYGGV
ncbi:hypothetical protein BJ508DRAFT_325806 [Ascobolus immersus RN42]|uniref:Uncharacterized protein n=1 Tax=Ascobolus immersus RN42 TaxID=1160509 RepID=A0A3N4I7F5_ASCIM|nr:hypothetical protein BJ508DRAFT_325806 [Ascobolus immersus RN42]